MATASIAFSIIWRMELKTSWRDIFGLCFSEDFISEIWTQKPGGIQVHFLPQNLGKLSFHGEKREPGDMPRLEFYEHIHIAARREIVP